MKRYPKIPKIPNMYNIRANAGMANNEDKIIRRIAKEIVIEK